MPDSLETILARLKADPEVEYAEPNRVVSSSAATNDPFLLSTGTWGQSYGDLWGLAAIHAPAAWDTATGQGVVVAVIDTGVDYTHPDIAANMWLNPKETVGNGADDEGNGYTDDTRGWDFVGADYRNPVQSNDPMDHNGHGTHVAGTIAATGNNNVGIVGVAFNSKIMALKGLDNSGNGLESTLAPAILYAAKNGADVINASWGGPGHSTTIAEAVQFAYSVGVVFVAAAGNSGADAWGFYPANSPEAITVGAIGTPTCPGCVSWTNYGTKVDVVAPGADILSLRANGTTLGLVVADSYIRLDGTSMAAPHVSGLAALLLSQRPGFTVEDLRQTLRASATSRYSGWHPSEGAGTINAEQALAMAGALQVHFASPAGRTRLNGPVTLIGTVQGTGFDHFDVEYGLGSAPGVWWPIRSSSVPVSNGALGVFDPSMLRDGIYSIRLTAFDAQGRTFRDFLELDVAFLSIDSPAIPLVPVTASEFKPGARVTVTGTATGPTFQAYRLEWAAGINAISGWSQVGFALPGGGASPVLGGTLGSWDTTGITRAGYYTIRLSADNSGFTSSASTLIYLEPDLISQNWPQALTQCSSMHRGMVPVVDASGNTLLKVVTPTTLALPFSQYLSFSPDGQRQNLLEFSGGGSSNNPAAGDVIGSGSQDMVFAGANYALTTFRQDNSSLVLPTKPAETSINYWMATPTMASLEGQAPLDIVALGCDRASGVASLYAWRGDGSMPFPNLPTNIPDQHLAIRYSWNGTPRVLVGDVNGDGYKEFVVVEGLSSSTYTLALFALDGTPIPWAVPVFNGEPTALVLADLDHNGRLETILVDSRRTVHVFQPDGSERAGWPQSLGSDWHSGPIAVGDIAHSGREQIAVPAWRKIYLFNADGSTYSSAWPLNLDYNIDSQVILADIDGDGIQELLVSQHNAPVWLPRTMTADRDSAAALSSVSDLLRPSDPDQGDRWNHRVSTNTSGQSFAGTSYSAPSIVAYRQDGSVARSWNLMGSAGNQPSSLGHITVGDFNHDGLTDLAVTYPTMEGGDSGGMLMQGVATVLSTGGVYNAARNDWPMVNRDAQNSSVLTRVQVAPPTPVISGAAPASAFTGGVITLSGLGFRFATAVKFNGTAAAFVVVSDISITATVPAGATSGTISVVTPGGTATSASAFTVPVPPSLASFSPASGPAGATVTLTGTNFTGVTAVRFNGTTATFMVASGTSIIVTVPVGATSGTISVVTQGGTATSASAFTILVPPSLSSFSPASGLVGTTVTLTGTSFSGATAVRFNGTTAAFSVASDASITATVPAGATSGMVSITTPGGTTSSASSFTVLVPPSLSSFSPASGVVGTTVTLTGTSFTGATAVTFNGTTAAFTVVSDTSITATVPAGTTSGTISIITPAGTATGASAFMVLVPPSLSSFSPATGLVGTTVTLTGTSFTGATAVTFNGTTAAFTVVSDTSITATVPAGTTSGTISVAAAGGTVTSASAFTVLVLPTIRIVVSPNSAAVMAGSQQVFTSSVTGVVNTAVSWSIASGGGSLVESGSHAVAYQAPLSAGTATIRATSQADGTVSESATITIKTRDLNGDTTIDVLDLATLARAFGSTPAMSNWVSAADLNGDGMVDDRDLILFLAGL